MTEPTRPFHIMAKPVCGVCNLDCRYCYYLAKPQELYPDVDHFMMSDETLDAYTRQYIDALPVRCEFGWQGGEPLLAGKEFFRKAMRLQNQYQKKGQVITNGLQTNGTLLDDEWAKLLAENNFLVGISLDGNAQWHDRYRKDKAGQPTYHRAWAGLELLQKHNVEFNVLATLNHINAPHAGDIYRYFVNRGIHYLQFIPVLERDENDRPTDFSCTGEQFGRFMLEVFDLWASRDIGRVSERFIDSVLHQLIFNQPAMCCYAERCGNAHVLEFNGDLYACDHFVYAPWKIGNIHETPLTELVQNAKLREFDRMKTELPNACRDCEYLWLCHSGCPKHHRPIGTDPERINHFCEGYRIFFREALPELKQMAEYFKRNETPPLKSANRGPEKKRLPSPAGPSPRRNDPCPCGSGKKFKNCCGHGKEAYLPR